MSPCIQDAYKEFQIAPCNCLEPCTDIKYSIVYDKETKLVYEHTGFGRAKEKALKEEG